MAAPASAPVSAPAAGPAVLTVRSQRDFDNLLTMVGDAAVVLFISSSSCAASERSRSYFLECAANPQYSWATFAEATLEDAELPFIKSRNVTATPTQY